MIGVALGVGVALVVLERLWPAARLPRVRAWWPRVVLLNLVQLGIVLLAGQTWDRWLAGASVLDLRERVGPAVQGLAAYGVATVVYYFWHRLRHESRLFWRLCHQLHHSPRRLEVVTAFYKHPVEALLNGLVSAAVVYGLLGCAPAGAAIYTLLAAAAEFFYHANIRTPRWLGYIVQRPEAHRVHHRRLHHAQNYADLPVLDIVFGTFCNPEGVEVRCGFDARREARFADMLRFRDVHAPVPPPGGFPLEALPTCIGCRRRWACHAARATAGGEARRP